MAYLELAHVQPSRHTHVEIESENFLERASMMVVDDKCIRQKACDGEGAIAESRLMQLIAFSGVSHVSSRRSENMTKLAS